MNIPINPYGGSTGSGAQGPWNYPIKDDWQIQIKEIFDSLEMDFDPESNTYRLRAKLSAVITPAMIKDPKKIGDFLDDLKKKMIKKVDELFDAKRMQGRLMGEAAETVSTDPTSFMGGFTQAATTQNQPPFNINLSNGISDV